MTAIQHKYDFVYLFDARFSNPNGDPDAGNLPRVDAETNIGITTDACLKRKIRNFVSLTMEGQPGYEIYMAERAILNLQHQRAYNALGITPVSKKLPKEEAKARELTAWMCRNFYDIRTFGAVMTTEVNSGQVRGPVQIGFGSSVEPIVPMEVTITRCAVTNETDAEKKDREMGRKHVIPYGLYRVHGHISANLAEKVTGFSEDDLALFWRALEGMFEDDRSAARPEMTARRLIVFEHQSKYGNAPADALFGRIIVRRKQIEGELQPARSYSDYEVLIDKENLPTEITIADRITAYEKIAVAA